MRLRIELSGVPIGETELDPDIRRIAIFEPLAGYARLRAVVRDGSNALWDLLTRPRQSNRGRRWRGRLVRRAHAIFVHLEARSASGLAMTGVRVFLFDCTRTPGPPIVVLGFDDSHANRTAFVRRAPPGESASLRAECRSASH